MKTALLFPSIRKTPGSGWMFFFPNGKRRLSRSQIKRLIEQGQVKVGGKKAKAGLRLKTGDEVSARSSRAPEAGGPGRAPSSDHSL